MPTETTSLLENLTDEQRDKVLTAAAEIALAKYVLKKMQERDAKKAAKAGQSQTNSTSSPKPEKS
jgi:hypothetical protein